MGRGDRRNSQKMKNKRSHDKQKARDQAKANGKKKKTS